MPGLTSEGFVPATAQEIRVTIANALKANLGGDIDTNPSSRIGQFIDIVSFQLESLWMGLEAVYDSQFPSSANGVALDNIGSLTNTPRSAGSTGAVDVYFGGQLNSPIPDGTIVAHINGFELATKEARIITRNCWLMISDVIPTSDAATFDLFYNGLGSQQFEIFVQDTPDQIKSKISAASKPTVQVTTVARNTTHAIITTATAHPFLVGQTVTIIGIEAGGFFAGPNVVTSVPTATSYQYANASGVFNPVTVLNMRAEGQTPLLTPSQISVVGQFNSSGGVWVRLTPTVPADTWTIDLNANAMSAGAVVTTITVDQSIEQSVTASGTSIADQTFNPHTIHQIVSSVPGVTMVRNLLAGISASDRESDAEYRQRLQGELSSPGSNTVTGIVRTVRAIPGVSWVALVDNPLSTVVDGRPPHSMEVYVEGGDDDAVAQAIYDTHPAGVQIVSTAGGGLVRSGNIIDVNAQPDIVQFSSVLQVQIKVKVEGTKNSSYPVDGDSQIELAVEAYVNSRTIAEVFFSHKLFAVVNTVPGIETLIIKAALIADSLAINAVINPGPLAHVFVDRLTNGRIVIDIV